jgi:hypothetical protein
VFSGELCLFTDANTMKHETQHEGGAKQTSEANTIWRKSIAPEFGPPFNTLS